MAPQQLETVAVLGNGIIGHGVAQVYAAAGYPVVLIGRNDASLARARQRIAASLDDFIRHGLTDRGDADATLRRITTTTDLAAAATTQLVIEAVTQDPALKVEIFQTLDRICPPTVVLGTSSGQPASEMTAQVRHRERVIATHFWYPPQLIPLVEVCAAPETSPEVLAYTCDAIRACGKTPAVIDREIAGFIGNRLQFAMLREAWSLWATGAASAEAIDSVVRHSIGRRLAVTGPIESADVGGLDTMYHFAQFLQPHLDTTPQPPAALAALVHDGHRGLPNGRGVYDWSTRDGDALVAARMEELFRWLRHDQQPGGGEHPNHA
jgi:3-hydroxybutyryl-CoA dehydrogenase